MNPIFKEIIEKCLKFNPNERISTKEILLILNRKKR